MDLLSLIAEGSLSRTEYIKAIVQLSELKEYESEHLILIASLCQYNSLLFMDYFDRVVALLINCSHQGALKCLGYIMQIPNIWRLVAVKTTSNPFTSLSDIRYGILLKLIKLELNNTAEGIYFASHFILSTKAVDSKLLLSYYKRVYSSNLYINLDYRCILMLSDKLEMRITDKDLLIRVFTKIELQPSFISRDVISYIHNVDNIPNCGPWSNLMRHLYITLDKEEALNAYHQLSLLLDNRVIISSIFMKSSMLLDTQVQLAMELVNLNINVDNSTVASHKSYSPHPTIAGWELLSKLVNTLDAPFTVTQLGSLIHKSIHIINGKGVGRKMLCNSFLASISTNTFDLILKTTDINTLLTLSYDICNGNEKIRLSGLKLFNLCTPFLKEIKSDYIEVFIKAFNKSALSGPFKTRWNGISSIYVACISIGLLFPFLKSNDQINDLTYTLISASSCKNSKVAINALESLKYFPYQDKLTLQEITIKLTNITLLSDVYKDKLTSLSDFYK